MHGHSTLARVLEPLLSRESILRSPLISSLIVGKNLLPIAAVCELPAILALGPSVSAVRAACRASDQLKWLLCDSDPTHLILPFFVDFTSLKIRRPLATTDAMISQLLGQICGSGRYRILRDQPWCARLKFDTRSELFAAWRALRYCPVNGALVDAQLGTKTPAKTKTEKKKEKAALNGRARDRAPRKAPEFRFNADDFPPLSALAESSRKP